MSSEPKKLSDYTLADIERELAKRGACIRWCRVGQNLNWKHFPGRDNWWHVQIGPARPESGSWRHGSAWGPSIDVAIALALRAWDRWTEPDFGEELRRRAAEPRAKAGAKKMGSAELMALLGLGKKGEPE